MRASGVGSALCLLTVMFVTAHGSFAQTGDRTPQSASKSDNDLREIASEIRLLRVELRRLSVKTHRSQVVLERIRLQQEQVVRLRRDLDVRDKLDETRAQQAKTKEIIKTITKQRDVGLKDDEEIKVLTAAAEELDDREQALMRKESALATEVDSAQAGLADLNTRLDEIEREMSQLVADDDSKGAKR